MKSLKALGVMLALFVGCYVPAFGIVRVLRLSNESAVPIIIGASLLTALIISALFLAQGNWAARDFGLRLCGFKHLVSALVIGGIFGIIVAFASRHIRDHSPVRLDAFSAWQIALLFWIAAPIQEEVIFRGLLQSVAGRIVGVGLAPGRSPSLVATALVAVLFALIHLPMGNATAALALLLGLTAGHLRASSSSLLPAVLVHSLFNIAGSIGSPK